MSESTNTKSPIFISYSRQDQAYVRKLISAFEEKGLSAWLDERIDYGAAWQKVIEDHLRACQVFVLVMTPRSFESHWVQCELSLALELKKPIFPLLLEGERWFSVASIQVVDVKSRSLPPNRFFDNMSMPVVKVGIEETVFAESIDIAGAVSADPSNIGEETCCIPSVTEDRQASVSREIAGLRTQRTESQPAPIDARYADLERYLKDGEWKEADSETYRLMITTVGKDEGQWFTPEELRSFPCEPLRAIDRLWVKHSGGRFGFSVQKKMYLECGGVPDGRCGVKTFRKLSKANGWRVNWLSMDIKFDTLSSKGHLPVLLVHVGFIGWMAELWEDTKESDSLDDQGYLIYRFYRLFCVLLPCIQTCEL